MISANNLKSLLFFNLLITIILCNSLIASTVDSAPLSINIDQSDITDSIRSKIMTRWCVYSEEKLDLGAWRREFVLNRQNADYSRALFEILREQADNGNAEAQQTLYTIFQQKEYGHVNLVEIFGEDILAQHAVQVLAIGESLNHEWALRESIKKANAIDDKQKAKDLEIRLFNRYGESQEELLRLYRIIGVTVAEVGRDITNVLECTRPREKRKLIDRFVEKYQQLKFATAIYTLGDGLHKQGQINDSIRLLNLAARMGNRCSSSTVAQYYISQQDQDQALHYLEEGICLGNESCKTAAAIIILGFKATNSKFPEEVRYYKLKALNILLPMAEKGDKESLYWAGMALLPGYGKGLTDEPLAFKFLELSAAQDYSPALYNYALMQSDGFPGHPADKEAALITYRKSASLGEVRAMCNAGIILERKAEKAGIDETERVAFLKEAKDLYERAIELGSKAEHVEGYVNVLVTAADLIEREFNDKKKALEYLRTAIRKSKAPEAYYNACQIHLRNHESFPSSAQQALRYALKAAALGYVPAMTRAAEIYLYMANTGDIASDNKNRRNALFWFEKAKSIGSNVAQKYLDLCKELTEEPDQPKIYAIDRRIETLLEESEKSIKMGEMVEQKTPPAAQPDYVEKTAAAPAISADVIEPALAEEATAIAQAAISLEDRLDEVMDLEPWKRFQRERRVIKTRELRDQLRGIGHLEKEQKRLILEQTIAPIPLGHKAILVLQEIFKTQGPYNIDLNHLKILEEDVFFNQGWFEFTAEKISAKKAKLLVFGVNNVTHTHETADPHGKHNQTFKGTNPAFIKDLQRVLSIFPLAEAGFQMPK